MRDYTPMEKRSPASRSQHQSYFKTTYKNQFYHWLASLIIVPTYVLCVYLFWSAFETLICKGSTFQEQCFPTEKIGSQQHYAYFSLWIFWLLIVISVTPVLLSVYTTNKPWWRFGFRKRKLLAFFSLSFSLASLGFLQNSQTLALLYVGVYVLLFSRGGWAIYKLLATKWQNWIRFALIFVSALILTIVLRKFGSMPSLPNLALNSIYVILGLDIAIVSLVLLNRILKSDVIPANSIEEKVRRVLIFGICWLVFLFSLFVLGPNGIAKPSVDDWLSVQLVQPVLWLVAMLIAADPELFISRQRAYIRNLTSSVRYDSLRNIVTPLVNQSHPVNRVKRKLRNIISSEQLLWFAVFIVILTWFGLPVVAEGILPTTDSDSINREATTVSTEKSANAAAPLQSTATPTGTVSNPDVTSSGTISPSASISTTSNSLSAIDIFNSLQLNQDFLGNLLRRISALAYSILLLSIAYYVVTFIRTRQKHIILPLELSGDGKESLRGIANQIQHGLVEEIQQIGLLLQLRQIENLRTSPDGGLTRFVATGQGIEFTEELRSLSLLEVTGQSPDSRIGRFLFYLVNTMAVVKVRGSLRRRADNSLQIWIELNRQGQSFPIDLAIVPTNFSEDFDEITVKSIARKLAVKLVQRIGNNHHLGATEESLESFLDGLAAAVEGNWWRAIDSFSTAIQIDEAIQGSFALGHYHLGSAYISVGELDEGIKHLEQAMHGDPLFAETRYMLALTKIYKHWGSLHKRESEVEFEKAVQNCKSAIQLRGNFAEAYHLLGSAHYHRGKLLERHATQKYQLTKEKEQTESLKSSDSKPRQPKSFFFQFLDKIGFSYSLAGKKRKSDIVERNFDHDYRAAAKFFRKAIRIYDNELTRVARETIWHDDVETEVRRIFRARVTATHQMGDALRSFRFFAEADTYYEEVHTVFPNDLRTLVDNTKLYCLAHQWQRADEFLSTEILSIPESHWNADVNMHLGWALSGGISEANDPLWKTFGLAPKYLDSLHLLIQATQHIDFAIHQRPRYMTRWSQTDWQSAYKDACIATTSIMQFDEVKTSILTAIEAIKSALMNEQNFIPIKIHKVTSGVDFPARLNQLYENLNAAVTIKCSLFGVTEALKIHAGQVNQLKHLHLNELLERPTVSHRNWEKIRSDLSRSYQSAIIDYDFFEVDQLKGWLGARMDMLLYNQTGDELLSYRSKLSPQNHLDANRDDYSVPNPNFEKSYKVLQRHYREAAILLSKIDNSGRLHGMTHAWHKLKLAAEALDNWKYAQGLNGFYTQWNETEGKIRRINEIEDRTIDLADRWTYATFISISIFATRWLIESAAYETAWQVAQISLAHLTEWREIHKEKNSLSIAPFVFRYARATLYAYKAFSAIQMKDEPETMVRLEAENYSNSDHSGSRLLATALSSAPEDVKTALEILPRHPLAMFVAAHLHRRDKLLEEAAMEFNRLAAVMSSFDPIDYLANWEMVKKTSLDEVKEYHLTSDIHSYLDQINNCISFRHFTASQQYDDWKQAMQQMEADYCQWSIREQMRYQEMVSGQGQLVNLVDKAQIHEQLARVYSEQRKWDLSVNHLMQATVWAMHRDLETEYLLEHAARLEQLERFRDARSVSKILKTRQVHLEPQTFSVTKIRQPNILAALMESRMRNFASSLGMSEEIIRTWIQTNLYRPISSANSLELSSYQQKLNDLDLVWFYQKLQKELRKRKTWKNLRNSDDPDHLGLPQLEIIDPESWEYADTSTIVFDFARMYLTPEEMALLFSRLKDKRWISKHPAEGISPSTNDQLPDDRFDSDEIRMLRESAPVINIAWNMSTKLLYVLCQESYQVFVQYCQLVNTLVYSRTELNLGHVVVQKLQQKPFHHLNSTRLGEFQTEAQQNQDLLGDIIRIMEWLYERAVPSDRPEKDEIRRNLRNYYDTLGWLFFRQNLPYEQVAADFKQTEKPGYDPTRQYHVAQIVQKLEDAHYWLVRGLSYDQDNAILYYHSARVHLAIMERLWQSLDDYAPAKVSEIAAIFQEHLRQASSDWRSAVDNDTSGRLRASLNWIGLRIESYSESWKTRFLSSLRGESKV